MNEALWLLTERTLLDSTRTCARQRPAALLSLAVAHRMNAVVSPGYGLLRLLDHEPVLAIRVLTDPRNRVQPRLVAGVDALLSRDMEECGLLPTIEVGAPAYALGRVGPSFRSSDVLAFPQPDLATADRLQQALVASGRPWTRLPEPASCLAHKEVQR